MQRRRASEGLREQFHNVLVRGTTREEVLCGGESWGVWVGILETEAETPGVCGRLWSLMKEKIRWGQCCESPGRGPHGSGECMGVS